MVKLCWFSLLTGCLNIFYDSRAWYKHIAIQTSLEFCLVQLGNAIGTRNTKWWLQEHDTKRELTTYFVKMIKVVKKVMRACNKIQCMETKAPIYGPLLMHRLIKQTSFQNISVLHIEISQNGTTNNNLVENTHRQIHPFSLLCFVIHVTLTHLIDELWIHHAYQFAFVGMFCLIWTSLFYCSFSLFVGIWFPRSCIWCCNVFFLVSEYLLFHQ